MNARIKLILVKFLKDNELILSLFNTFYKLKNKRSFFKTIEERKQMSIFDYKRLAADIPFYPMERVKDSNYFGHIFYIKKYANLKSFPYALEHGLYYDDYVPIASFMKTTHKIATSSDVRRKVLLENTGKEVLAIGPYIHYAESLISEDELNQIKDQLGRTLLFFPSHSSSDGMVEQDVQNNIRIINEIKEKYYYDTVIVNMFYLDIISFNYDKEYLNAGYKIVTAGHRLDINFIARLKSIISLSDCIITDSVGTHIGYSVFMNKPLYLFNKNFSYINCDKPSPQIKEIGEAFTEYNPEITNGQFNLISKYWGFDNIKTPNEISSIINAQ